MKKYFFFTLFISSVVQLYAQRVDTLKVKVHDHGMTLYASGAGSPAVILEAGGSSNHKTWNSVLPKIAKFTRVISYDRPGYLNSDTCSKQRDALNIAKELKEALERADIKPPYILSGWSMGGAFVRVFAGLFPKDVAGLTLVDPVPEESYARFDKEVPELLADDEKYMKEILASKTRIGEREEMRYFDSTINQARRSDQFHSTPTTLLIAAGKATGGQDRDPSNPLNKIWIEELEKWAKKRPNLKYEIIRNSGHHIARSQPDTVVHAIRNIVKQWQAQRLKQSASAYKNPDQMKDGIVTATLKDVELDEKIIHAMTDSIATGAYINIHSVLILRNNKLVYEQYFPGYDYVRGRGEAGFRNQHRDTLHDIRSITKSITSAAIMIAHAQGKFKSVDQRVFDYLPEFAKYDTGMKRHITLQHLLNMTTGLEWKGGDQLFMDSMKMADAPTALEFILKQRLVSTPGKKFNYSDGSTQLLAAILEKATGMNVEKFTNRYLFQPMGISNYEWTKQPGGMISGWAGLRMRSRDLLKFGMLYLNGGKWNGKQIIPSHLVTQSLKSQVSTPYNDSTAIHVGYSNQFWVNTYKMADQKSTGEAVGNGGQLILIDKALNTALVVTAGNYYQNPRSSYDIYPDFIYPAVVKKYKYTNKKK